MTKILFLIPPSEGKNSQNKYKKEELSFNFIKPNDIANNVSEKDLKCKGDRFLEGLSLNRKLTLPPTPLIQGEGRFIESIERYSGVMYNSIDYSNMSESGKDFFEENFLILSGMYGMVKLMDKIGNYKLPIETKGLYDFWGTSILEKINELKPDFVVNLLPISYAKLILGKTKKQEQLFEEKRNFKIININFLKPDGKKVSHGVKKIKGEWIKNICENNITDYKNFGGEIVLNGDTIDVNIIQ